MHGGDRGEVGQSGEDFEVGGALELRSADGEVRLRTSPSREAEGDHRARAIWNDLRGDGHRWKTPAMVRSSRVKALAGQGHARHHSLFDGPLGHATGQSDRVSDLLLIPAGRSFVASTVSVFSCLSRPRERIVSNASGPLGRSDHDRHVHHCCR